MSQQPYRPDVILNPQPSNTGLGGMVPQFTDLAAGVDKVASKIPWWVWLAGGAAAMWYFSKNRSRTIKLG